MSPYELLALFIVLPIVGAGLWVSRKLDTDGAPVTEFEAWCGTARPLLLAVQCGPERSAALAADLAERIGPAARVQHRQGRFPWTRYVLKVAISSSNGVVRVTVVASSIRRVSQTWPDIGDVLDRALEKSGLECPVWVHTELYDGDDARGASRRGRGWTATIERGRLRDFVATSEPPAWARASPEQPGEKVGVEAPADEAREAQ